MSTRFNYYLPQVVGTSDVHITCTGSWRVSVYTSHNGPLRSKAVLSTREA